MNERIRTRRVCQIPVIYEFRNIDGEVIVPATHIKTEPGSNRRTRSTPLRLGARCMLPNEGKHRWCHQLPTGYLDGYAWKRHSLGRVPEPLSGCTCSLRNFQFRKSGEFLSPRRANRSAFFTSRTRMILFRCSRLPSGCERSRWISHRFETADPRGDRNGSGFSYGVRADLMSGFFRMKLLRVQRPRFDSKQG